jgi:hypothetical protein
MLRVWVIGEVYTGFWWGNLRERGHLEAQAYMEGNIKLDRPRDRVGSWTGLISLMTRDRWRAVVNTVMNIPVP